MAVYFVTAKFGLNIDPVSGFATLVWLPTGISLAVLLLLGYRFWPAIALGAFLANFSTGAPLLVALAMSLGNTLEAALGVFLLKKIIDFRPSLDTLKDVLGLVILAAVFSTLVSATIGTSALWLGKVVSGQNYLSTWLAWWVGDMVSDLVVAPFILVWSVKPYFNTISKRTWEALGLSLLVIVISGFIFRQVLGFNPHKSPVTYLLFPPLVWAALRFGQRGAVTTTFILSGLTLWATGAGFGPFLGETLSQRLLSLQFFIAVIGLTGMVLGAIAMEKDRFEQRKDEFISVASHELKTPITTIKGYTQILNKLLKGKNKNLLAYTAKMEEQLNRLTKLVNDLLDVSKIQTGKLELQREKVKIDDLIKDVTRDIQMTSNHQIIFKKNGRLPRAWVDKYLISQVLINLISNAIKYSPKANKVFVRSLLDEDIIISVQDFGIGISAKDKEKIFERFYQADTRIRQSFQGLGLGLYISYEIIKSHGGNMWVESVKGKGSTLSFSLPTKRSKYD